MEYCDILNALANVYYNTDRSDMAASLKLLEINIRERLEGSVSLTNWGQYFVYIVDSNPEEVIRINNSLVNVRQNEGGNAGIYITIGKAYSILMNPDNKYRDTAEMYFNKTDSILLANSDYYETYNLKNLIRGNLFEIKGEHYSRLGQRDKSFDYSEKSLLLFLDESSLADSYLFHSYYKVALKSALLHDTTAIHKYLPNYFYGMEKDLSKMLPVLGSVESDTYLANGNKPLYHIPEWASWNPTDSVSVSIAYDAALLIKGLTLRYNTISPYLENHPNLASTKLELDRMRDSIYSITDENTRLLALHRYELKEREILKDVNAELTNVHWKDIANELKNDEACK